MDNFNFIEHIKYLDMACMLQLYQEGTSTGHVIVADLKGVVFTHLTKVILAGPIVLKNFLQYLQEGMSIRLKGLHFINIAPFMDKILALVKPLKKMELLDVVPISIKFTKRHLIIFSFSCICTIHWTNWWSLFLWNAYLRIMVVSQRTHQNYTV